jgi:hypothetical protein
MIRHHCAFAAAVLVVLVALSGCAAGSHPRSAQPLATVQTAALAGFAGTWNGHDRHLHITAQGAGEEIIDDGCCSSGLDLRFQLSEPSAAGASLTVVSVTVSQEWRDEVPTPRVGEKGRLSRAGDVVQESLTTDHYCLPGESSTICGG